MKAVKLITHSYTLIICFLLIMISGEHLGGFYLLYILLALPVGALHSILAVAGISLLLFGHHKYHRKTNAFKYVLNIGGVVLLFLSIFYFFNQDRNHYNYGTFYQTVPLMTLVVTAIIASFFLVLNVMELFQKKPLNDNTNLRQI